MQLFSALLAYDYIITIDQEIAAIWFRKCTSSTLLFLFNRYISLVAVLLQLAPSSVRYVCDLLGATLCLLAASYTQSSEYDAYFLHTALLNLITNNIKLPPGAICIRHCTSPPNRSICT